MRELEGPETEIDQCMFGLKDPVGNLLKKPTIIKTNIPGLVRALQGMRCLGDHSHGEVQGQQKGAIISKWSQVYPKDLCKVFATEVRALIDVDNRVQ